MILFDLGGVIAHTRGFESVRELLVRSGREAEARDPQALRDRWLSSTSVRDFELGHIDPTEFAQRFVEEWRVPVKPDDFLADVRGWIDYVYPGAEELLDALRREHLVCCLSNCNELHWQTMAPLLTHFDFAFSSHIMKKIKPDEEAFLEVLRTLDAEPEEVSYFDDSRANVTVADRLGMKAHLVHGIEQATEVLRAEGML